MRTTGTRRNYIGFGVAVVIAGVTLFAILRVFGESTKDTAVGTDDNGIRIAPAETATVVGQEVKPHTKSDDRETTAVETETHARIGNLSPRSETSSTTEGINIALPEPQTRKPSIHAITAKAIPRLVHDCPGQSVPDCRGLSALARTIAISPAEQDGGWPEWMEAQVLADLELAASPNHFSQVGANCSNDGCIIYVAAAISTDLPEGASDKWRDEFERWLSRRTWAEELTGIDDVASVGSLARNRIIAITTATTDPYAIWYTFPRRP